MFVYILLFGLILLAGLFQYSHSTIVSVIFNKEKYITGSTVVFVLALVFITFVEAMRSVNVGEDLIGYISWFNYYKSIPITINTLLDFSAFEPGFMLLYKAIALFFANDQAFIIVTSALIVFLNLFFLYKNSRDFYLSLLLFLGFNHFFTSMVSLRQYIAIGIVMWILPNLNNKKYGRALLLAVVAFFFHMTSIIATAFIVVGYIVRTKKIIIPWALGIALSLIPLGSKIFTFLISFFPKYQLNYSLSSGGEIGSLRLIYILLEVVIIVYVYFSKRDDKEYTEYSLLLIPAIMCGLLTTIPHIFRVGYYFDYFLLLLIPKIVEDSSKNKYVMRFVIIIISAVFFFYYLSINPGETVPYEFY